MEEIKKDKYNIFFDVQQKENIYIDFDKIENKNNDNKIVKQNNFQFKRKLERENERKAIQLLKGI